MALKTPLEKTNSCFPEQGKLSHNSRLSCYFVLPSSKRKTALREGFSLKDFPYSLKEPLHRHSSKNDKILLARFGESQYLDKKNDLKEIGLNELKQLLNPRRENKTPKFKQTTVPYRTKLSRIEAVQIEKTFFELAKQWHQETRGVSSTNQMSMHPAYQQIIGMGEEVVPLLLRELERKTGQWFWALKAITREDPVPPEFKGKTKEMIRIWLDWGRMKGYVW